MKRHADLLLALALDLVGAAGALLVSLRTWQVITSPRERPFADVVLGVNGRTVDSAPTALALVALAGVVALLATRGTARRVIGVVLALAGIGLVWRALASAGAVSTSRARDLITERRRTVVIDPAVTPHVDVNAAWPTLTVVCGVLVLAAGVIVTVRGHRWQGMSARYEPAPDPQQDRARAATSLWTALDRGEDPTSTRSRDDDR